MKKIYLAIILSVGLLSCKERLNRVELTKPVPVSQGDFFKVDSTATETVSVTEFPQNVLIEDFTGVTCPNCPTAHNLGESWVNNNPGRISLIALHPHSISQANPATSSKYDFRISDVDEVVSDLGVIEGLPSWSINRKRFPVPPILLHPPIIVTNPKTYQSNLSPELNLKSPAGITVLSAVYNSADSSFTSTLKIQFASKVTDTEYVSVAFIQSGIVDFQLDNNLGEIKNYIHNNILRAYLTPLDGILQPGPKKAGSTFYLKFRQTKKSPEWKAADMKMVVILHRQSATDKSVIQVAESKFN